LAGGTAVHAKNRMTSVRALLIDGERVVDELLAALDSPQSLDTQKLGAELDRLTIYTSRIAQVLMRHDIAAPIAGSTRDAVRQRLVRLRTLFERAQENMWAEGGLPWVAVTEINATLRTLRSIMHRYAAQRAGMLPEERPRAALPPVSPESRLALLPADVRHLADLFVTSSAIPRLLRKHRLTQPEPRVLHGQEQFDLSRDGLLVTVSAEGWLYAWTPGEAPVRRFSVVDDVGVRPSLVRALDNGQLMTLCTSADGVRMRLTLWDRHGTLLAGATLQWPTDAESGGYATAELTRNGRLLVATLSRLYQYRLVGRPMRYDAPGTPYSVKMLMVPIPEMPDVRAPGVMTESMQVLASDAYVVFAFTLEVVPDTPYELHLYWVARAGQRVGHVVAHRRVPNVDGPGIQTSTAVDSLGTALCVTRDASTGRTTALTVAPFDDPGAPPTWRDIGSTEEYAAQLAISSAGAIVMVTEQDGRLLELVSADLPEGFSALAAARARAPEPLTTATIAPYVPLSVATIAPYEPARVYPNWRDFMK